MLKLYLFRNIQLSDVHMHMVDLALSYSLWLYVLSVSGTEWQPVWQNGRWVGCVGPHPAPRLQLSGAATGTTAFRWRAAAGSFGWYGWRGEPRSEGPGYQK